MTCPAIRSRLLLPMGTLALREWQHFFRSRSRIVGALGTPLVFWGLLGAGFRHSFSADLHAGPVSYLEYSFPGMIVLILLFSSVFSMFSVIEDRREGFLQAALVAPAWRGGLVLGKVIGSAAVALVQGLLFSLLAPLAGISMHATQWALLALVAAPTAISLTGVGFVAAWVLDSTQGFHAIMNLVLLPLWLLSGAVFPPAGASAWLRVAMWANPLTYAVAAVRHSLYAPGAAERINLPSMGLSLAVVIATGAVAVTLAAVAARREGRPR